jgi:hypothetical protein
MESQKQKRIRRRSLAVQLESALRDAEAAATSDISTQKLIQTRLNILSKALARERNNKLKQALAEVTRLAAEVERLTTELAQALKPAQPQVTELDRFLQTHGVYKNDKSHKMEETQ